MTSDVRVPVMGDVARLAGVSSQTVSRVINDHPHIRPETRSRVEQAIAQLGYRPNIAARTLVRGRSGVIGAVTASDAYYGPRSALQGISTAARSAGFAVASIDIAAGDLEVGAHASEGRERLLAAVDDLTRLAVEGIVVVAGFDSAVDVALSLASTLPVVVVEGDLTRSAMTVGVDQVAGAMAVVEHLLALGHRRVAHVCGPDDWPEARARVEGWRRAMASYGLASDALYPGDWSAASGYAAAAALLEQGSPLPTAVFAGNDQMALGLLRGLHERGIDVPGDVSVAGFDDIPEAAYLTPPLTTVQQDFAEVGRRAVDVLVAALRGDPPRDNALIAPTLLVRGSTAPPARSGSRPSTRPGTRRRTPRGPA